MKIIGLDAGHGLKTSGKQTPDGIKEWTLNDKVRDKVVSLLKGYDVKFIFTDEDEGIVDEALATRVKKYINGNVDAFVSIHHNAYTGKWSNVTGVEVYVDKAPTSKDNELANAIYKRLPSYTGLKGRGVKKENWYVINQNKVPAVLVEGGFMDSNNDYKVITSNKGQDAYARAVAEGLIEYLGLKKKEEPKEPKITTIDKMAIKLKTNANLWDLNFANIKDAKSVKQYKAGDIIENIAATATHACGSKYYMTEYSYNNNIKNGFNIVDCEEYIEKNPVENENNIESSEKSPVGDGQITETTIEETENAENILIKILNMLLELVKKIFGSK